jgi:nucleotide-binding universal stress UspA family protein
MYERILVALDQSAVSDRVLAAAKDLASMSGGKVWVLHLREREVIGRMGLTEIGVDAHGEIRETVFGHAAREIIEDAKLHDADVIVMGSRGRGDLAGLVLGSTAHKVIHLADRPVLVVR